MEIIDRAAIMQYLEVKWPGFVRDALALPEAQQFSVGWGANPTKLKSRGSANPPGKS